MKPFHGTCGCSLIVGKKFGVYKGGDLVLIKMRTNTGSMLNGLSQMIVRLLAKTLKGENVKGYTVLLLAFDVVGGKADDYSVIKLKEYLSILMRVFQVVVVTAAGNYGGPINEWPALFSLESDLITVGSVVAVASDYYDFGSGYPWSCVGPALTISAPGQVQCARPGAKFSFGQTSFISLGTSVSAAIVSGLVAYFLDLPLGDQLRQKENIPLAVKKYIRRRGFARDGDTLSVWNGLDADEPGQDNQYGWDGQYGL